ncbi:MAG: DUF3791 domain-containing protein [Prevotellaceae bacterium]|nr:DUF3791 domain-containing protein [Candidatus Colivivens equi]
MSKLQINILDFLVSCIGAFAERFSLTNQASYSYLSEYKGLDFLLNHYAAEHTLSIEDAVDDITTICHRNGGGLL